MPNFDREEQTFNLLKMTDSGSESVPDLDLVIPVNTNKQKKKVRLKRKERKTVRQNGSTHHQTDSWWTCSIFPQSSSSPLTTCWSSTSFTCLLAVILGVVVVMSVILAYITSNLHNKILVLETQLRSKIVEDDSKSIPETLQLLETRLSSLANNQTSLVVSLGHLKESLSNLQIGLEKVNRTVNTEGDERQVKQSIADLGTRVSEIRQTVEMTVNSTSQNTDSLVKLSNELNSLKLDSIDLNNGAPSTVSPVPSQPVDWSQDFDHLNSSISLLGSRIDNLNKTVISSDRNSSVMINWVKQDVLNLQGRVSQLQDDNVNVSSRLASLTDECQTQLVSNKKEISKLQINLEEISKLQISVDKGKPLEGGQTSSNKELVGDITSPVEPLVGGKGVPDQTQGRGQTNLKQTLVSGQTNAKQTSVSGQTNTKQTLVGGPSKQLLNIPDLDIGNRTNE